MANTQNNIKSYTFNVFVSILTLILTLISSLIIIAWIWSFVFNERPTTTFTAQISKIGTDDEEYFMEFNQYRNKNNNKTSKKMNELKLTYHTDEFLTSKFSTGIQVIGEIETFNKQLDGPFDSVQRYNHEFASYCDNYFYNQDATGKAYTAVENISKNDYYIIEIKSEIYKLEFNETELDSDKLLWMKQVLLSDPVTLFEAMTKSVESLPVGDYVINFPLGKYFDIWLMDDSTKQFNKLNVQSKNKIYVEVKVHIEDRGATNSTQSIFKLIQNIPNWNTDGIVNKEYWKVSPVKKITNADFINKDGYISLNMNLITYLNAYSNLEIYVELNITEEIKGFDYYALYGIKLNGLKISSENPQQFEIKNLALKNTGIEINEIVTTNVQVVEVSNG